MIRFASLFLALNILLCYGGMYRDAFAVNRAPEAKTSHGCHGMTAHESKPSESTTHPGIANESSGRDSSCCHDALTNTNPDLNSRIEVVNIDRTHLQVINESKSSTEKLKDVSPREHDPPDLQISFSTFLL